MIDNLSTHEYAKTLTHKARQVYGDNNQVMVCIEELAELSAVLAKYPRYETPEEASRELGSSVLDEVADVEIILYHIKAIFNLTDSAVETRKLAKLDRLSRWLSHSSLLSETLRDRTVETQN